MIKITTKKIFSLLESKKIKISAKVYSEELDLNEEVNGEIEIEI